MAVLSLNRLPSKTYILGRHADCLPLASKMLTWRSLHLLRHIRLLSTGWKQQRDADIYANRAIQEGLRSRAAYKLDELNKRFGNFLRQGAYVVDLGAAPGGFAKIVANHINLDTARSQWHSLADVHTDNLPQVPQRTLGGSQRKRRFGQLICADLQDMEEISGAVFVRGDTRDDFTHRKILLGLGGQEADIVLSDMSPSTTGEKERDHLLIMQLAEEAFSVARKLLRNGGTFCCKVFQGGEERDFRDELEDCFVQVKTFKPAASRKVSKEIYYIAQGFVPEHLDSNEEGKVSEAVDSDLSGLFKGQ